MHGVAQTLPWGPGTQNPESHSPALEHAAPSVPGVGPLSELASVLEESLPTATSLPTWMSLPAVSVPITAASLLLESVTKPALSGTAGLPHEARRTKLKRRRAFINSPERNARVAEM